jgi:hypothetical protein
MHRLLCSCELCVSCCEGDAPPPGSLAEWIPRDKHDIYVIAVEECKYAPRHGNASCEVDWFNCVQSHLGPNYIKVTQSVHTRVCGVRCAACGVCVC